MSLECKVADAVNILKRNPLFESYQLLIDNQSAQECLFLQAIELNAGRDFVVIVKNLDSIKDDRFTRIQFQIYQDTIICVDRINEMFATMQKEVIKQVLKQPVRICKECGATPAEPNSDYCKRHINTPQQTLQGRFTEAYHRYLNSTRITEVLQ